MEGKENRIDNRWKEKRKTEGKGKGRKRTREFFNLQFSHFDSFSPFQCCNHVTVSTERISTLKRGRRGLAIDEKRRFLKLREDADGKRLFCSNVSTLLSLIVDCKSLAEVKLNSWLHYLWEGLCRSKAQDARSLTCKPRVPILWHDLA